MQTKTAKKLVAIEKLNKQIDKAPHFSKRLTSLQNKRDKLTKGMILTDDSIYILMPELLTQTKKTWTIQGGLR